MLKGTRFPRREGVLIRLTGSDGSEGWGETAPLPGFSREGLDEATGHLRGPASSLLGCEISGDWPDQAGTLLQAISRLDPYPSTRFGLELAALNLAASSAGKPLPELIEARWRRNISVNGLLSGGVDGVVREAHRMRDAGYLAVKLKVGRLRLGEELDLIRKVGDVLGDVVSLRLDANRGWSYEEAMDFARGISGTAIEYVEEPLSRADRLPEFSRESGLSVALDESLTRMEPEELGGHRYARTVVLKPTLLGGISRTRRFAERARRLGMKTVISSSYESGVGTAALVALAATTGTEPAGLDTYRRLSEDAIEVPLDLSTPTVDVRETTEAAKKVDVGRLETLTGY